MTLVLKIIAVILFMIVLVAFFASISIIARLNIIARRIQNIERLLKSISQK